MGFVAWLVAGLIADGLLVSSHGCKGAFVRLLKRNVLPNSHFGQVQRRVAVKMSCLALRTDTHAPHGPAEWRESGPCLSEA